MLKEANVLLRRKARRISPEAKNEVERHITRLERALSLKTKPRIKERKADLRGAISKHIPRSRWDVVREWSCSLATAILLALVIRQCAAEPYKIPSGSMLPTLNTGDKILVSRFSYGLRIPFTHTRFWTSKPQRWDVIVFSTRGIHDASQYPRNFVKRVVGLPGETLAIRDGRIYRYLRDEEGGEQVVPVDRPDKVPAIDYTNVGEGRQLLIEEHDYVRFLGIRLWKKGDARPRRRGYWKYGIEGHKFTVPPSHYFVLGDNTANSADSRAWGFVPFENIKGRVICKWSFLPPWGRGMVR